MDGWQSVYTFTWVVFPRCFRAIKRIEPQLPRLNCRPMRLILRLSCLFILINIDTNIVIIIIIIIISFRLSYFSPSGPFIYRPIRCFHHPPQHSSKTLFSLRVWGSRMYPTTHCACRKRRLSSMGPPPQGQGVQICPPPPRMQRCCTLWGQ